MQTLVLLSLLAAAHAGVLVNPATLYRSGVVPGVVPAVVPGVVHAGTQVTTKTVHQPAPVTIVRENTHQPAPLVHETVHVPVQKNVHTAETERVVGHTNTIHKPLLSYEPRGASVFNAGHVAPQTVVTEQVVAQPVARVHAEAVPFVQPAGVQLTATHHQVAPAATVVAGSPLLAPGLARAYDIHAPGVAVAPLATGPVAAVATGPVAVAPLATGGFSYTI